MLDEPIDNTTFLKMTFGAMPELKRVHVSKIIFEPPDRIAITFLCTERAKKLPAKWQDYNTIGMTISFYNVGELTLSTAKDWSERLPSNLAISRQNTEFWRASLGGAFECEFVFQLARADDFFPALLDDTQAHASSTARH
jgi:hypothetical protein